MPNAVTSFNETAIGTAGSLITAHTSDSGSTYTNLAAGNGVITAAGKVRSSVSPMRIASAFKTTKRRYTVQASFEVKSDLTTSVFFGGQDINNHYTFAYSKASGSAPGWSFFRAAGGSASNNGNSGAPTPSTVNWPPAIGSTHILRCEVTNDLMQLYVDDTLVSTYTDTAVSKQGFVGFSSGDTAATDTTGVHIDNVTVTEYSPAALTITSAPTSGNVGAASTAFTVAADEIITTPIVVTPTAGSGGGQFTPATVTLTNASPTASFTYTPASAGTKSITTTNDQGLTNAPAQSFVATSGVSYATIAVDDPAVFYSPENWRVSGGIARAVDEGAYFRRRFTGTSLAINVSQIAGWAGYQKLRVQTDDLPYQDIQLNASSSRIVLASGLADAEHETEMDIVSMFRGSSAWTSGSGFSLRITSYEVDAGRTVLAPTRLPHTALLFGSSSSMGVFAAGAGVDSGNDATVSFVRALARGLNAELGMCGHGGQGVASTSGAGVPGATTAYSSYYSGASRLVNGKFASNPDYIFVVYGSNGDSNTASTYLDLLNKLRAAAPNATLICITHPVQTSSWPGTIGGYNAFVAAGDTNAVLIEGGAAGAAGLTESPTVGVPTWASFYDGLHPTAAKHAQLAGIYGPKLGRFIPRRFNVTIA